MGAKDYITLNRIVENARDDEFPQARQVYKVKRESETDDKNFTESATSIHRRFDQPYNLKNKFLNIKVKEQDYLDVPGIAIYLSDYTQEMKENLIQVQHQEQF